MSSTGLESHLYGVELFQGLNPRQIAAIARRAERMVFKPGAILIADGTSGDAAYVIVAGEAVRLSSPNEKQALESILPGALIGEMAMLIDVEHSSTVAALSQVRALRLSRQAMTELMLEDSTLADHLVQRISVRLHGVLLELSEIEGIAERGPRRALEASAQFH